MLEIEPQAPLLGMDKPAGQAIAGALRDSPEPPAPCQTLLECLAELPLSGKPTKRWRTQARECLDALAAPQALLDALTQALLTADDGWSNPYNEQAALAIVTLCGEHGSEGLVPKLGRLARHMAVVLENGSPRSLRVANGAILAIAELGAPTSLGELTSLKQALTHGTLRKQLDRSIDTLAQAREMSREALLEQAVETHGLGPGGTLQHQLSDGGQARIVVEARAASLEYVDPNGKAKRSFPAAVKSANEELLASLKDKLKAIRKTLAGERDRLESELGAGRSWPLADWRRWYLDHPITGQLSRALIWVVTPAGGASPIVGIPTDATTLSTVDGSEVSLPQQGDVQLWHPVAAAPEQVAAWRRYLLKHELLQPIKQAYREIYVRTPAERETGVYSNRFAGHVFGQQQARALMKRRGWQPGALIGGWDMTPTQVVAKRALPGTDLTVHFHYALVDGVPPEDGSVFPLCASDQVRFHRGKAADPLPLEEVPPLAFSEAMRDVDLFMAVTSIGADPEWEDHGPGRLDERLQEYWSFAAFGELRAAALVRRELLAEMLPGLRIADRLTLQQRFLRVRGNRRTYRIHLGSGNILMEPDDTYLCIVRAKDRASGRLFLPVDDDPTLSLILSKAFLLAADDEIADPAILEQLGGRARRIGLPEGWS